MAYSDDYIRHISKKAISGTIRIDDARKIFLNYFSEAPEDLIWDVFAFFFPDKDGNENIQESDAFYLSAVIDLFEGEYDEHDLKLTDDELTYISEGVNDYALELSDEVLMNVMKAAVSRGLMG